MYPSNIELLRHILEEASFILDSTIGKNKEHVVNDPILSRALIRSLEIIGEASSKVDPDFKTFMLNGEKWQEQETVLFTIILEQTTILFRTLSYLSFPT